MGLNEAGESLNHSETPQSIDEEHALPVDPQDKNDVENARLVLRLLIKMVHVLHNSGPDQVCCCVFILYSKSVSYRSFVGHNRVAESEVKYAIPIPTPTFPKFPTPTFQNFRLRPFQNFRLRLLNVKGIKFAKC